MARKPLIRSDVYPYHVTARSNNREPFYCGLEDAWRILNLHLAEISEQYGVKIHAFVLMPNHFHLIVTTPNQDLGVVMQKFMMVVTRTLNIKTGRTGRVFGAKYHWSLINTDGYFDYALKYLYRNPVKAKLVDRVEDYPFSTIGKILGLNDLIFPIYPPVCSDSMIPGSQMDEFLSWLNQPFKTEQDEAIQKALRKTEFSPVSQGWKRQKIKLQDL